MADTGSDPTVNEHSRAYQIEMYEKSMSRNVIVAMETGSGKTQIAKLRIEAELERSPLKRVWFCAPKVVLAQQQYTYLSTRLPSYRLRLITGLDNAQFWSTKSVWDAVLENVHVVVSTPQVLLDALTHAFVTLDTMSLLVFDEAHHCAAGDPTAKIMQHFYHPLKDRLGTISVPHILGLTATAITNSPKELGKLESLLNATCRTPQRHLVEYKQHTHIPQLDRLPFANTTSVPSQMLQTLTRIVGGLTIFDDPRFKWLQAQNSLESKVKLEKILHRQYTPVMKQMRSFQGHVEEVERSVGTWAARKYAMACVKKLHSAVERREYVLADLWEDELRYMSTKLKETILFPRAAPDMAPGYADIASKSHTVINYLLSECTPEAFAIIFVKRRSVAFALTALLGQHSKLRELGVFSFIGASNIKERTLVDLMDVRAQIDAFVDFRKGRRHILVATPVMEEGIDVQAVNIVIRFDEPDNFRSFIQGRGRARHPDSKIAMVCEDNDSLKKVCDWNAMESEMQARYKNEQRIIAAWEAMEAAEEDDSEEYRVISTGAVLTYHNARQHVDHFCSKLPEVSIGYPAAPIIIISGKVGESVAAQIRLPSSVAPLLQVTNSLQMWRTEKAATKDAAFQCYKKLHINGAISDHLLPFPKVELRNRATSRESYYDVQHAIDPWEPRIGYQTHMSSLSAYRVQVSGGSSELPSLLCFMHPRVQNLLKFQLRSTPHGDLTVEIVPYTKRLDWSIDDLIQSNKILFLTTLGRRLQKWDGEEDLPYLLCPDLDVVSLRKWLLNVAKPAVPLVDLSRSEVHKGKDYLVSYLGGYPSYRWDSSRVCESLGGTGLDPDGTISALKLTRQLNFVVLGDRQHEKYHDLEVKNCRVEHLAAKYAEVMRYVPSITHMLGATVRGKLALARSPLNQIGFRAHADLVQTLTTENASNHNYDRLEFLGDAVLKYFTSCHLFFGNPMLHEGALTAREAELVSNARLQQITRDLGLDAFISSEKFSGSSWTLNPPGMPSKPRRMSSKVLADVVEAIIGAAFLESEKLVPQALSVFLPEEWWRQPAEYIKDFGKNIPTCEVELAHAKDIEQMLAYSFRNRALLVEALTKTSSRPGIASYERLEYLGDGIIDRIVSAELFRHRPRDDSGNLTSRLAATVNEGFLGFLALDCSREVIQHDPVTTSEGIVTFTKHAKTVRLIDYITTVSNHASVLERERVETAYLQVRESIVQALTHGKNHPWTLLESINSPKMYGDIIEALVGAMFIDSNGNLDTCKAFLENLGMMKVLFRRLLPGSGEEPSEFDVVHPLSAALKRWPRAKMERTVAGSVAAETKEWTTKFVFEEQVVGLGVSNTSKSHADCLAGEAALKHPITPEKKRSKRVKATNSDHDDTDDNASSESWISIASEREDSKTREEKEEWERI